MQWDRESIGQPKGSCSDLSQYTPYKGQTFHLIFANWSFEYLRYDRAAETFERLSKYLVEGGLFMVKGNWKPDPMFKGKDELRAPLTAYLVRKPWMYKQLGHLGPFEQYKDLQFSVVRH